MNHIKNLFTSFPCHFKKVFHKKDKISAAAILGAFQCDQIWLNSTALANIQKSLAIYKRFIWFWEKFSTHFGTISMLFGQIFIAENGQILITQSGLTGAFVYFNSLMRKVSRKLSEDASSWLCDESKNWIFVFYKMHSDWLEEVTWLGSSNQVWHRFLVSFSSILIFSTVNCK